MDKVTNAMQDFVSHFLGERFIEPQTADLTLVYKDSSPTTPLIFVLSPVRLISVFDLVFIMSRVNTGHRSSLRSLQIRRRYEVQQKAYSYFPGTRSRTACRRIVEDGHGTRQMGFLSELPLGTVVDAEFGAAGGANR